MHRIAALAAIVALAGCAEPLAIMGDNGFLLHGTVDSLTGKFTATDGKLVCSGENPQPIVWGKDADRAPVTLSVACNDGRKGVVVIGDDGGHLRLTDGTKADFVMGPAAGALTDPPTH